MHKFVEQRKGRCTGAGSGAGDDEATSFCRHHYRHILIL